MFKLIELMLRALGSSFRFLLYETVTYVLILVLVSACALALIWFVTLGIPLVILTFFTGNQYEKLSLVAGWPLSKIGKRFSCPPN